MVYMPLDKREMFRMPWSLTDNPIGWLEVTDVCNINCKGCYRSQLAGHRELAELKAEIRMFRELRNCDGISIAGGEPLLHPQLPEVVAHIRKCGMKAVLLSNTLALDHAALVELKQAGLEYLTLHVDQWQTRKGWTGKNELQLLDLRQEITDRVAEVGGYHLTFGCTVYNENLPYVTAIADWARRNAGQVDGLVFITFRGVPTLKDINYVAPDKTVDDVAKSISYTTDDVSEIQISSNDVWHKLQEQDPAFHSGAYLGGTVRHSSFKWLVTARAVSRNRTYGYAGPRVMEAIQHLHHDVKGTYPAYMPKSRLGPLLFAAGIIDPHLRRGGLAYLGDVLRNPLRLLDPVHVQSIVIVQAPDLLADGSCDMCDSCPDMTFYKGELVRSCRWDEYRRYGALLQPNMHGSAEQEQSKLVHDPRRPTLPHGVA
jgi:MoaA/NifB/PqqE/SkfB family radical SAM enzyme